MTYDSLLLNCGGGIISASKQSPQYRGAAAVAIGIGGTGVDALSTLKSQVHQQLIPDNPGEPLPRYNHIQFLAIDSDETALDNMRGNARLDKASEFFSIQNPQLSTVLTKKNTIKSDPFLNWMEIDRIDNLLSPMGAGGVRQVGRYLLISKAAELRDKIESICNIALSGLGTAALDIYIFAGISGGTGSGCFLDVCYIVQNVLESKGWRGAAKIMGFFFLPDVVTSKPAVAAVATSVQYNNSNGYAAMKELDYLMSLKEADDHFRQNYKQFKVDTQAPPVDLCHLISATKSDGSVMNDGYRYGIHVASDYVMAYLADVALGSTKAGDDDKGLTMRGHLANVTRGVEGLPRNHGANLSYHVLGAANAEIPMTQISTYLAAGFYRRFEDCIGQDKFVITKADVDDWCRKIGFTVDAVYDDIVRNTDTLSLPEIDRADLASEGPMPKGKAPNAWSTPGNEWLSRCSGKRAQNRAALNGKLETWDYANVATDSLLGKVFRKLYDLSVNSDYGPYYAAGLLHHAGYDMMSAIQGAIVTAEGQRQDQLLQLRGNGSGGMSVYMMQCSADFCAKKSKKYYAKYLDSVQQWYIVNNRVGECEDVIATLTTLKTDLIMLYNAYFAPLLKLLDNLRDTFQEDANYLLSPAAAAPAAYTWRILELKDIRPRLDVAVDALQPNQLVNSFMDYILAGYGDWQTGDEGKISKFISIKMEDIFRDEMERSLQDYLFDIYTDAGGDVSLLSADIREHIIGKVHQSALPMFWCDPTFPLHQETFRSSSISVPNNATAICTAADDFKKSNPEYVVRKTGLQDRIFALRFFSGVPFYAYQGVTRLKEHYDNAGSTAAGVGSHLYALTGRGEDGSGDKDWRNFLPVPVPYSQEPAMVPNAPALLALYDEGLRRNIIQMNSSNDYVVLRTPPIQEHLYTAEDFVQDGVFQAGLLDSKKAALTETLQGLYTNISPENSISLKNDGYLQAGPPVVDRVRKDYFLHYPKLHQIVSDEIAKCQALESAIATLEKIQAEQDRYTTDLDKFCSLLFYRLLPCTDGSGKESYSRIVRIVYPYTDSRGQAQTQVFAPVKSDLPVGADYPLYLAFRTYCALNPSQSPRRELDEALAARQAELLRPGDNIVGYTLEQEWDSHRLADLDQETRGLLAQQYSEIMRFYYGLVKCIARYRDKFSHQDWISLPAESTGAAATPSAPASTAAPKVWTVWTGEKYLYVYEGNLSYGWDKDAAQWCPITPNMSVWQEADQSWQPIVQTAQGQFILP